MNRPWSFVKSIAPFSVSPSDAISFILSIQHSLDLPLFLFPLNLAYSALCGIRSIVFCFTCYNKILKYIYFYYIAYSLVCVAQWPIG